MLVKSTTGGVLAFVLDYDDFQNECKCETYPLLRTINRVFQDENSYENVTTKCSLVNQVSHYHYGP